MSTIQLVCTNCQTTYPDNTPIWQCSCGGLLDLNFTPTINPKDFNQLPPNMWRYHGAIPIKNKEHIVSFGEGFTPLLEVEMYQTRLKIKQDHLFPSGSYKDRGASVLISKVKELGIKKVVEDSSGNAGSAIAAYCAKASLQCDIYVPENTAKGKLAQISRYGANLIKIPGNREATARAVLSAAYVNYYASHSWNPYFFHGTKTFAYEVWEQLGFRAPQLVILPVGNGTLLLGAWLGFSELKEMGMISAMPKIFGVQTANCAPLYQAALQKQNVPAVIESKPTIAQGIAIAEPIRGKQIMQAVKDSEGEFISVSEEEIKTTLKNMHKSGFYIEPTSAATIAAIPKVQFRLAQTGEWVSVFTGNGLKATDKILSLS